MMGGISLSPLSIVPTLVMWERSLSLTAVHCSDDGYVGKKPLSHRCPLFRRWLCGKEASLSPLSIVPTMVMWERSLSLTAVHCSDDGYVGKKPLSHRCPLFRRWLCGKEASLSPLSIVPTMVMWERSLSLTAVHCSDDGYVGKKPLSHRCPLFRRWLCGKEASHVLTYQRVLTFLTHYPIVGQSLVQCPFNPLLHRY